MNKILYKTIKTKENKTAKIILMILLFVSHSINCFAQNNDNLEKLISKETQTRDTVVKTYLKTKKEIRTNHNKFIYSYKLATTKEKKDSIVSVAKKYLIEKLLGDLLPAWEDTNWSHSGYTVFPKTGGISNGWYIYRLIEHLDFNLEKKGSYPQYFAMNRPNTMVEGIDENSKIITTENLQTKHKETQKIDEGIYIIGFSATENSPGSHVGLLIKTKNNEYITHSLGIVETKEALNVPYYVESKTIRLGELFNKKVVNSWLENKPIKWY